MSMNTEPWLKKQILIDLYKTLDVPKIANIYNCKPHKIYHLMRKFGIERRKPSEYNKGEKHPMFGKKRPDTIERNKIGWAKLRPVKFCIDCNKEIYYTATRCYSCEAKRKMSLRNLNGKANPAWIDGRSYFPYPPEFNQKLKDEIRERDGYICQGESCGITEEEHLMVYGSNLSVHHIDYNKENCNKDNLVSTCNQCNLRANINRSYWQEYYKQKVLVK